MARVRARVGSCTSRAANRRPSSSGVTVSSSTRTLVPTTAYACRSVSPGVAAPRRKRAVNQNLLPPAGVPSMPISPPHGRHDLPRDRQPEAGATVPPGRGEIGLGERLEHRGPQSRVDADPGVLDGHVEDHAAAVAVGAHRDQDLTSFGELHRVGGEVGEHLRQAGGVAAQRLWHVRVHRDDQFQGLGPDVGCTEAYGVVDDGTDLEVH